MIESSQSIIGVLVTMTFNSRYATGHIQARRNHPSYQGGNYMSGKTDKVKGKLKQAAGDLTGNRKLRREGKVDELAGKAKDGIDRVAKKFTPERGTE